MDYITVDATEAIATVTLGRGKVDAINSDLGDSDRSGEVRVILAWRALTDQD